MHLSSDVQIPEGLLAANALLAENSRQGFGASTHTVYQGFGVAISSTAIGIPGTLYDGRVRCRYTGKERDAESGLDYFGARYYGSSMGRFMSPDWNSEPEAIPFADLRNPQSLNLYSYVHNNPLRVADPDGHDGDDEEDGGCCDVLPSKEEVDAALAGIAAVTEAGVEWTVSTLAAPVVAVGGMLLYAPDGGGGIEDRELRQMAQRRQADAAHRKDARPSTKGKHQKGQGRKKKDGGGEKGDAKRRQNGMYGRKPPPGHKGPWPPRDDNNNFNMIPVVTDDKDNSTVTTTQQDHLPPPPPPQPQPQQ